MKKVNPSIERFYQSNQENRWYKVKLNPHKLSSVICTCRYLTSTLHTLHSLWVSYGVSLGASSSAPALNTPDSSARWRICSMFSSCRRADSDCFCCIFFWSSSTVASWAACKAWSLPSLSLRSTQPQFTKNITRYFHIIKIPGQI